MPRPEHLRRWCVVVGASGILRLACRHRGSRIDTAHAGRLSAGLAPSMAAQWHVDCVRTRCLARFASSRRRQARKRSRARAEPEPLTWWDSMLGRRRQAGLILAPPGLDQKSVDFICQAPRRSP